MRPRLDVTCDDSEFHEGGACAQEGVVMCTPDLRGTFRCHDARWEATADCENGCAYDRRRREDACVPEGLRVFDGVIEQVARAL